MKNDTSPRIGYARQDVIKKEVNQKLAVKYDTSHRSHFSPAFLGSFFFSPGSVARLPQKVEATNFLQKNTP